MNEAWKLSLMQSALSALFGESHLAEKLKALLKDD